MRGVALRQPRGHAPLRAMMATIDPDAAERAACPPIGRMAAGLAIAPLVPAAALAVLRITWEACIGCWVALLLGYAMLALTGFVRLGVPGDSNLMNAMRAAGLAMVMTVATSLSFVLFMAIMMPPFAGFVIMVMGGLGLVSGLLFWALAYAAW